MLFNSLEYAVFLPAVVLLHFLLRDRARNRLLLVASYAFYGAWDYRFLSLILFSTAGDYWVGSQLAKHNDARTRRQLVVLSLVTNLGLLGFFKYAGFFAEGFADLMSVFGFQVSPFVLDVVLPVGISFYTFQTLSYTLDIYRGGLEPSDNPLDFALFVALFPQLVAGPIERARHLLPQITAHRIVTREGFVSGLWLILWGIFKKVVIADNLAGVVDGVFAAGASPTGPEVLLASYAFTVQIYCDFSGYTDIARGSGRLLGFDLTRNFDLPFISASPAEIWQRWHITLSTWLRDYLFTPLSHALMRRGGERFDLTALFVAQLVTMTLCGLWHGAAWTYVAWGVYQGVWLVLHRGLRPWLATLEPKRGRLRAIWHALCVAVTFHGWVVGLVLFRSESIPQAGALLATVATSWKTGLAGDWLLPFAALCAPLVAMQLWQLRRSDAEPVLRAPLLVQVPIYVALAFAIAIWGEDFGEPFIYFQF
jgi:alginate O-acetyltransferase complex protein AlgI